MTAMSKCPATSPHPNMADLADAISTNRLNFEGIPAGGLPITAEQSQAMFLTYTLWQEERNSAVGPDGLTAAQREKAERAQASEAAKAAKAAEAAKAARAAEKAAKAAESESAE